MNLLTIAIFTTTKVIPLIYALLGFGILIAVHEFGHFIFCKLFKIDTPTFSIGMGPTIFKKQIGKTSFRIAAIPLGGYVEIAGLAEVGQGDQKQAGNLNANSFNQKPYWQRFFVLMGGIIFNLLFAYAAYTVLFVSGMPQTKTMQLAVQSVQKDSAAEKAGIKAEDIVLGINQNTLSSEPHKLFAERQSVFLSTIKANANKKVKVSLLRNNKKITKTVKVETKEVNGKSSGFIGLASYFKSGPIEYTKYSIVNSFKESFKQVYSDITLIIFSLKTFITQKSLKGAGGPIMIISHSSKLARKGIKMLLRFLALISVNLAVINILPLGALDGGQLLFETIEAIIRRKIPEVVRNTINIASWIFLLTLIIMLSYNDILALFKR